MSNDQHFEKAVFMALTDLVGNAELAAEMLEDKALSPFMRDAYAEAYNRLTI